MDAERQLLAGWGRVAPTVSDVSRPRVLADVEQILAEPPPRGVLARGLGRSYGDAAQNAGGLVADMTGWSGIRSFDPASGEVRVAAGTSLDELLRRMVPNGWFVPVTPGTRFVTIGGAIASDIHGKNHHVDGGFCRHVPSFDLVTPGEGRVQATQEGTPDVFWATAGGLGLTGIVVEATIRLFPIETARMLVDTERANDLDDLMSRMAADDDHYRYSVAWLDSLARGRHMGRGVLTRGDHARLADLPPETRARARDYHPRPLLSLPSFVPPVARRESILALNELWFRKAPRSERGRPRSIASFFHPLDGIGRWNRVYGPSGFVQYQFVVPFGKEDVLRQALERLSGAGCPSFLTVLKRFGEQDGLLAFPSPGWTLAMDIPARTTGLGRLLDALDTLVAQAGGRIYLTKDSRLRPELLTAMYPGLDRWREVRARLDPNHVMRSDLDRRLDLSGTARRTLVGAGAA